MELEEKLLSLSEKEIEKELSDNIYKSKYVMISGALFEKVGDIMGERTYYSKKYGIEKFILKYLKKENSDGYIKPLAKDDLKKIRLKKIEDYFSKVIPSEKAISVYYDKAKNIFGEDYVDYNKDGEYILIHFPSITISNSFEQSLEMKDLFLRIKFRKKRIDYIELARTTLSEDEVLGKYIFSHLNYDHPGSYSGSLCMGDTVISKIYSKTQRSNFDCFKYIEPFYHLLKEYLSWESLEGVPYKKIDHVLSGDLKYKSIGCPSYDMKGLLKKVYNNIDKLKYKYELINGKYSIKLEDESILLIDNILSADCDKELLFKRINGASKILNKNIDSIYENYHNKDSQVEFKGKRIKIKIEKSDNDNDDNDELKIHSSILQSIVRSVEIEFSEHILNKKIKKRG